MRFCVIFLNNCDIVLVICVLLYYICVFFNKEVVKQFNVKLIVFNFFYVEFINDLDFDYVWCMIFLFILIVYVFVVILLVFENINIEGKDFVIKCLQFIFIKLFVQNFNFVFIKFGNVRFII